MRGPDVYYGETAANYDSGRQHKAKWRAEIDAVGAFLTEGPVLDVPFGTGRFVPIYQEKGLQFLGVDKSPDMLSIAQAKYPGVNAVLGSAFDLPDGKFGTVVCVRFLEWMPVEKAKLVLNRLRKLAPEIIVTITHGVEGCPEAYTYDFGKFLTAIDGLLIENRRVTAQVRDMTSEIFKLRPAKWSDVLAQFSYDHINPEADIQRIADKHCEIMRIPKFRIAEDKVSVRAEYWTGDRLKKVIRQHDRLKVEGQARHDGPITIFEMEGASLLLDGRHRAGEWQKTNGPHPVLVLRHIA